MPPALRFMSSLNYNAHAVVGAVAIYLYTPEHRINPVLYVSLAASGVLKGFDPLLNLVLDGTIEYMRGK